MQNCHKQLLVHVTIQRITVKIKLHLEELTIFNPRFEINGENQILRQLVNIFCKQ